MAGHFTDAEWTKIIAEPEADPAKFGRPEAAREGSLVQLLLRPASLAAGPATRRPWPG